MEAIPLCDKIEVYIYIYIYIFTYIYTQQYSTIVCNYNQARIYAQDPGARAQGGILKKLRLKYGMRKKKGLSTREKFKGDLY